MLSLVPVSSDIRSSYQAKGGTGGPRAGLVLLSNLAGGKATPDTAAALLKLHEAVTAAGGDFRITDCHRDAKVQAKARAAYESGQRKAYVAVPGRSMHNAGRAVDIHIDMLKFPGVPADKQLDKLWELAKPLGWRAIIKQAIEGASESWHFDYPGELAHVYDRLDYAEAALCGSVLVGHADRWQTQEIRVQALCHRAGVDVGALDGVIGAKTKAGILKLLGNTQGDLSWVTDRLEMLPAKAYGA